MSSAPKWDAIESLIAIFEDIAPGTPDGYHFTLRGFVYPTFVPPEQHTSLTSQAGGNWAYVCVPLDNENDDRGTDSENRGFTVTVRAFVGESEYDQFRSSEVRLLCELQRDLCLAVSNDPQLRETVNLCMPLVGQSVGGWPVQGKRYGELRQPFRIVQYLD